MADIVVATAIIAFSFFFMSIQNNLKEWSRRLFQVLGFMSVLLMIGMEMAAASEGFMSFTLWVYAIAFVMMTLIDLILLVRDVLMMAAQAGD